MTDEAAVYAAALVLRSMPAYTESEIAQGDIEAHHRAVRAVQRFRDWRDEEAQKVIREDIERLLAAGKVLGVK